jgi:hypothetical protein
MFFVPAIFYPLLLFTTKVINVAAFLQEEACGISAHKKGSS